METSITSNKTFFKNVVWYLLGTTIPMGINLVKTPIFTRHYSPEDYGYLGLVLTIFMYLSTVSYAWLASCIWRYYHTFESKKILKKFYSNLVFLFGISTIILFIFSLIFLLLYHSPLLISKLIIICFFHFIFKELLGLYFIILRIKGEAKESNILLITQTVSSFFVLLFLAFCLNFDISSLILSSAIIDLLYLILLSIYLFRQGKFNQLKIKFVNRKYLKLFFGFGSFIILSSLFTLLIVSSDRYILAMYDTIENVGIYTKVYDIAQISITALVFVFFSVINPKMNKELANNLSNSNILLKKYLFAYLLILLPVTFIASIFSKEFAELLLGKEFQEGFQIIPYVFFSTLIYGIITFNQNKLKFSNRLKSIIIILFICFFINLILNFIFIPQNGYYAAATSTLFTYLIMLILFFKADSIDLLESKKDLKLVGTQLFILLLFFMIDQFFRKIVNYTILIAVIEGIVFCIIFFMIFRKQYKELKFL
jgi:O-antigen/teichoic acid export membrane protein